MWTPVYMVNAGLSGHAFQPLSIFVGKIEFMLFKHCFLTVDFITTHLRVEVTDNVVRQEGPPALRIIPGKGKLRRST